MKFSLRLINGRAEHPLNKQYIEGINMNSIFKALLTYAVLFSSNAIAQDNSCDSVLIYAATNQYRNISSADLDTLDYFYHCEAEGKNQATNGSIGYKGLELKLGGSGSKYKQSCSTSKETYSLKKAQDIQTKIVVPESVKAWEVCKTASKDKVDMNIKESEQVFNISLTNESKKEVNMWTTFHTDDGDQEGLSCKINRISQTARMATVEEKSTRSIDANYDVIVLDDRGKVSYSCERKNIINEVFGDIQKYKPGFTVSVNTTENDYIIEVPKIISFSKLENELKSQISGLQNEIAALEGKKYSPKFTSCETTDWLNNWDKVSVIDASCPDDKVMQGFINERKSKSNRESWRYKMTCCSVVIE